MGLMMSYTSLKSAIENITAKSDKCIIELMVHPGYPNASGVGGFGIPDDFSKSNDRLHELNELCNEKLLNFYKINNIKIISYKELKSIKLN